MAFLEGRIRFLGDPIFQFGRARRLNPGTYKGFYGREGERIQKATIEVVDGKQDEKYVSELRITKLAKDGKPEGEPIVLPHRAINLDLGLEVSTGPRWFRRQIFWRG